MWSSTGSVLHRRMIEMFTKCVVDILENIREGFFSLDDQFKIMYFNGAAERLLGRRREDVVGQSLFAAFPESKGTVFEEHYLRAAREREPHDFEAYFGVAPYENWYSVHVCPHSAGISVYFEVTTEHRQTEETLRAALVASRRRQEEVSALLEGARAVLRYRDFAEAARVIFDECVKLIGATAGYVALLSADGINNDVLFLEPGGRPCSVDPLLPMPIRGLRAEAYRTQEAVYENDFCHCEWVKYLPEGHVEMENVLFAPLVIDGQPVGLLGLACKPGGFTGEDAHMAAAFGELAAIALLNSRTLESLAVSEKKYHSLFEHANDSIFIVDPVTRQLLDVNENAARRLGYTRKELLQLTVDDIDTRSAAARNDVIIQELKEKGSIVFEHVHRHRDGTLVPVEISSRIVEYNGEQVFQSFVRDISKRKEAEAALKAYSERLEEMVEERTQELREAQEKLVRREKLTVLGQLAGSVGHDLRNPLGVISNAAYYLQTLLADAPAVPAHKDLHEYLDMITSEAHVASEIVSNLLNFARTGQVYQEYVDLVALIRQVLSKQTPPQNVHVHLSADDNLPWALIDARQIEQVLINLLINAYESMSEGGTVEIRVWSEAGWIQVSISDTGCGIPAQNMEKLFQPLFTTKKRGMGLGLATVKSLVKANGGDVWVESEEGQGCTFTVRLLHRPEDEETA